MLPMTDEVKGIVAELATFAIGRKRAICELEQDFIDVPPVVVAVTGDTLTAGESPMMDGETAPNYVRRICQEMFRCDMRRFDYVAAVVDSFVRFYDRDDVALVVDNPPAQGELATAYASDPFSEVLEGFTILVVGATGDYLDAFIQYKRDDSGMPYVADDTSVVVSETIRGCGTDTTLEVLTEFVMNCRLSARELPPSSGEPTVG